MQSKTKTVKEYLAELPEDRRKIVQAVRKVVLANLDDGFEEGIQYGMIGYFVPHRIYPSGYHCDPKQPLPFAALAAQKNYFSLYLMRLYGDKDEEVRFREAWALTGKKLDMGKSCIRFKKLEDLDLEIIGDLFQRSTADGYIAVYKAGLQKGEKKSPKKAVTTAKKPSTKNVVSKKVSTKKVVTTKKAKKKGSM